MYIYWYVSCLYLYATVEKDAEELVKKLLEMNEKARRTEELLEKMDRERYLKIMINTQLSRHWSCMKLESRIYQLIMNSSSHQIIKFCIWSWCRMYARTHVQTQKHVQLPLYINNTKFSLA